MAAVLAPVEPNRLMVMQWFIIHAICHPVDLICFVVQTVHRWTMLEALHFQMVKCRPTTFGMVRFIKIEEQAVLG